MDRVRITIMVGVAAKGGENPPRRRGQGSSTMFVSRGLVDPKTALNRSCQKEEQVNIPAPLYYLHISDASGWTGWACQPIEATKSMEYRNGEKWTNLRPGGRTSSPVDSWCQ